MKLSRIETPGTAHYAYLIEDGGEAAVVDPRRDVDDYLEAARKFNSQIKWVIETHRQEDFVMGSDYLARQTGAKIVNGDHELFGHGDVRLKEGDTFNIGELTVRALHTPGHTMESMCYAVYSPQNREQAWCVFTGDAHELYSAAMHLSRIGIDNIQGGLKAGFGSWRGSGNAIQRSGTITSQERRSGARWSRVG